VDGGFLLSSCSRFRGVFYMFCSIIHKPYEVVLALNEELIS
jgi:hypothetical protein